ncbi:TetR/AcrR family transcriptional regulator [Alkaliphilus transvaalensis]|uniref:TetR/AcrR family transcriptional regulator n=1 Tax=Alkaliphilus transvaalensis TaxID=114628 RepID=UPI0004799E77|nr:TetR/AcrR family transcriptional regulator [Alkaliphilus transvaalensis]
MPKNTYFNLQENKRNLILEVSIDEFSRQGYENASISNIVKNAGIAKGSFYQYFEDKKDLFKYIIEVASIKKVSYLGESQIKASSLDFFELLRVLYRVALQFLRENPKLALISDDFAKNTDREFKEEILGVGIEKSNEFLKELLQKGIYKGEINSNIDIDFIAYMLTSLSIALGDYCRNKFIDLYEMDEIHYYKLVDQTIELVKQGIKID